jgi:hypothetical protein
MSFICPRCSGPGTLEILASIALAPDSRSDEIALQIVVCKRCGLEGLACYEESRRGSLNSESWNHTGYLVPGGEVKSTWALIRSCHDPENPRCDCPVHRRLGRRDANGRWSGLEDLKVIESFLMVLDEGR